MFDFVNNIRLNKNHDAYVDRGMGPQCKVTWAQPLNNISNKLKLEKLVPSMNLDCSNHGLEK